LADDETLSVNVLLDPLFCFLDSHLPRKKKGKKKNGNRI